MIRWLVTAALALAAARDFAAFVAASWPWLAGAAAAFALGLYLLAGGWATWATGGQRDTREGPRTGDPRSGPNPLHD